MFLTMLSKAYIEIMKKWMYPYWAVDSRGNTTDFRFSVKRDARAAKRVSRKGYLKAPHNPYPNKIFSVNTYRRFKH